MENELYLENINAFKFMPIFFVVFIHFYKLTYGTSLIVCALQKLNGVMGLKRVEIQQFIFGHNPLMLNFILLKRL